MQRRRGRSITTRRVRAPEVTRGKLLGAAFDEIYRRGYQAASIDSILADTGVTKGALYHHFPGKASLGYAVVDEVVTTHLLERWLGTLGRSKGDPLTALQTVLRYRAANISSREVELGCPLNNLAQEMSPLDEGFRRRINVAFDAWRDGFARALKAGQIQGTVRKDVDAEATAAFLVAAVEGSFGVAKSARRKETLRTLLEMLADFLETLRPAHRARVSRRGASNPGR